MLLEQTLKHLSELNLAGMKIALQQQAEQPKTHQLSFEERIGLIVDYEKTYRYNRKIERLIKTAHLRQQACIEDIQYIPARGLNKSEISSLASASWVREAFNLTLTGSTGTGKSWIACALGHQVCRQGLSVFYTRLPRLFEQLRLDVATLNRTCKLI